MKEDPRFFNLVSIKGAVDSLFSRFDADPDDYKAFLASTGGAQSFASRAFRDPVMAETFVELFNMKLRERQIFNELPVKSGRGPDKAPRTRRTRAEIMAARAPLTNRKYPGQSPMPLSG